MAAGMQPPRAELPAWGKTALRIERPSVGRALLAACLVGITLIASAPTASAFPVKLSANGEPAFAYGSSVASAGGAGTAYDPQSKLFYTGDGNAEPVRWWAVLGTTGPTPAAGVWLFELVNHSWTPRVRLPGADPWAKADALFEGGSLFIATADDKKSTSGNPRQSSLY